MELKTEGAVRAYDASGATGIRAMGDKLLLISEDRLTLLSGEMLTVDAEWDLGFPLEPEALRLGREELSYFDPRSRETLVLDGTLTELRRIPAPADMVGSPILSDDGRFLYYCTQSAIRAWDFDSGVRRPVKELSVPGLTLQDLHEGKGILQCAAGGSTLLLSAENGRLLWEGDGTLNLHFRDGLPYAQLRAGAGQRLIFGDKLLIPKGLAEGQFLPQINGAVTVDGSDISYYNLETGRREEALNLQGVVQIEATEDGFLYLLTPDALYRWEIGSLPTGDSAIYTAPNRPDEARLALCKAYAEKIGAHYGITVLIGEEAAGDSPWDYSFEAEVLPPVLEEALTVLDEALSHYPEAILAGTREHFDSLTLSLVRTISGSKETSVDTAAGVQYLRNREAHVALAIGPGLRRSVYHEFYHVMETHLLGTTTAFDRWDRLNPAGFAYGQTGQNTDQLLTGERRAFIDRYSMKYPKEDRARILEYAMEPENEALFQSPILQTKLQTLCEAIREAYGLKKSPDNYLWEQYLVKPLAYVP